MAQMWGLSACAYYIYCGKDLTSSSNTVEVSSNSSLEARQGLAHPLKGFILFCMSPLAAAGVAQIMTIMGVMRIFPKGF